MDYRKAKRFVYGGLQGAESGILNFRRSNWCNGTDSRRPSCFFFACIYIALFDHQHAGCIYSSIDIVSKMRIRKQCKLVSASMAEGGCFRVQISTFNHAELPWLGKLIVGRFIGLVFWVIGSCIASEGDSLQNYTRSMHVWKSSLGLLWFGRISKELYRIGFL